MHSLLLLFHSTIRYFVLIFLILIIIRSLMSWMNKKNEFTKLDDKFSLWSFILTHTQLLIGIILYFTSPAVIFSGASMKEAIPRYWLIEHNTMMLIAIALITIARISIKKIPDNVAKHRRLFVFNAIALVIILAAISMSGRGFFNLPAL